MGGFQRCPGVSLQNIFWGLLLGNLLAVLSWRYLCAPIAVKARYTLYYHLEKIAGGNLAKFYNLANGVLFCFLAGAGVPRLWCGGLEAVGGD